MTNREQAKLDFQQLVLGMALGKFSEDVTSDKADEIVDKIFDKNKNVIMTHIQDLENVSKQLEEYEVDDNKIFINTSKEIKVAIFELEEIVK